MQPQPPRSPHQPQVSLPFPLSLLDLLHTDSRSHSLDSMLNEPYTQYYFAARSLPLASLFDFHNLFYPIIALRRFSLVSYLFIPYLCLPLE